MVELKVKARPVGATARLGRHGHARIVSETGGEIDLVTGASMPGFNPLDLLYASLAGCLVLSARIAASRLGLLDRFQDVAVHVTGRKTEGEPARVETLDVRVDITGDLDAAERAEIVHMAEEICAVSNTLQASAQIRIV